jgi:hypothetical protein
VPTFGGNKLSMFPLLDHPYFTASSLLVLLIFKSQVETVRNPCSGGYDENLRPTDASILCPICEKVKRFARA